MEIYIASVKECLQDTSTRRVLAETLGCIHRNEAIKNEFLTRIDVFLQTLRDDLTVVVETEYVDKVYRNSF